MSMKIIAAALTVIGATMAMASTSVMDVKVQPRSPWNGLVDIDYFIVSDNEDDDVYVNPVGYDGDRGITMFPTSFTGDGADAPVKPGKHRMTWDAKKDFGKLFSCANFQIILYVGKRLPRYVIVDLSGGSEAENYPVRFSVIGPDISSDVCRTTELWLRLVPPGSFWMGSPEGELGREENEDLHKVNISKPFYMGVFEVTQRQWELVVGSRSGYFYNDYQTRPVENVSLIQIRGRKNSSPYLALSPTSSDVDGFMRLLRLRTECSGFDLPTEAQWEYACRAGTTTALNNGGNLTGLLGCHNLNLLGRYYDNGYCGGAINPTAPPSYTTAKVGSYLPNNIGLYDMHGNVWEVCRDYWKDRLGTVEMTDPMQTTYTESSDSAYRGWIWVCRGGSWDNRAQRCRSARRGSFTFGHVNGYNYNDNYIGFRLSATENLQ